MLFLVPPSPLKNLSSDELEKIDPLNRHREAQSVRNGIPMQLNWLKNKDMGSDIRTLIFEVLVKNYLLV